MKSDFDLNKHRRNNSKTIRNVAIGNSGGGKWKHPYAAIVILLAAFVLFFLLNDRFLKIDGVPTFEELFTGSVNNSQTIDVEGNVSVHYIDVGQGDCQLIVSDSCAVLIDCGEKTYSQQVINYIKALEISRLDYVIATHPHSDHIGGMSYILDEFDIGTVIMPEIQESLVPTTNTYMRMLESISNKAIAVEYAEKGSQYKLGDALMTVLSPVEDYKDLNNYSVSVKLVHGDNSFLFTGDIEKEAESDILDSGADVKALVLKVAHHGSNTSSQEAFLEAVNPAYAVIGVGTDNSYGHPHKETIDTLNNMGITTYRTDLNGNIVFISDGNELTVQTDK